MSRFFTKVFYVILGLTFSGYLAFQLEGLYFGSKLKLEHPQNGEHLRSSRVVVKGLALAVNSVELNGRQIFTDDKGNFEEELILPYGLNIIKVSAEGRFGKKFSEERMVYITGL